MYVVTNRVAVADGYEDMFEERFKQRASQIDKQPGFVRMQVLRPVSEDAPFVVMTSWQDEAAFKAWVDSEDFKIAHRNPMPKEAFKQGGGLEQFEVIVAAEKD